jgi:hypothetical protein
LEFLSVFYVATVCFLFSFQVILNIICLAVHVMSAGLVEFDNIVAWFAKREGEEMDKVRIEMMIDLFMRLKHDLVCYRVVMTSVGNITSQI